MLSRRRPPAGPSHLIEAFHAKATYGRRVLVLAGFCALHKKLNLTLRNVNTLGPEGRQLIATPVRAWTRTAVHDGAPKVRQSNSVKFQLQLGLSHLQRSVRLGVFFPRPHGRGY